MKKSPFYKLEIAPTVIIPRTRSPLFSYLSPDPIPVGSYVSIPFGKRTIEGVVFQCTPLIGQPPHWMKFIGKTLEERFLTDKQLQLATYVSEEYYTPLGKTLKHFLPKRTKTRTLPHTPSKHTARIPRPTLQQATLIKSFAALQKDTVGYLNTSHLKNPKSLLVHLIKKEMAKKQQVLVLVPEISLLLGMEAFCARFFPQTTIATLHSQLSDGMYSKHWEAIRSGEASLILATRQGLFAPFHALRCIFLLEEQDESYKQWDMSPRYDARRVVHYLASLHQAKLLLTSATPSIESYQYIKDKAYTPIVPLRAIPPLSGNVEIVNLRLERFKKNYSPLSQTLVDALQSTLARHEQALLYIHRQGMSAFSICEHCKNIFRCPRSGHALNSGRDGVFRCLTCGYATGAFPSCSHCGHLSFRSIGFGTERIEREVMKLFPGARVFRADRSSMRSLKNIQKFHEQAASGAIDVLIGTQMILKDPVLPKLSLIAMIDADSLLAFPDFRADEKMAHILYRATTQAKKVIIQTFHPESSIFQNLMTLDSSVFADRILSERASLHYPPFSRLISIACQGTSASKALSYSHAAYSTLEPVFKKENFLQGIPPQAAKKTDLRKAWTSIFHIKMLSHAPYTQDFHNALNKISHSCIIDVDPLTLSS